MNHGEYQPNIRNIIKQKSITKKNNLIRKEAISIEVDHQKNYTDKTNFEQENNVNTERKLDYSLIHQTK